MFGSGSVLMSSVFLNLISFQVRTFDGFRPKFTLLTAQTLIRNCKMVFLRYLTKKQGYKEFDTLKFIT